MADFVKVAKTDEIVSGQGKMIEVGGKKIALFNVLIVTHNPPCWEKCEMMS